MKWLNKSLDDLVGRWRKRPPHAVLISGQDGIGLDVLGNDLARALLCERPVAPSGRACGTCPACNWMSQGNHPDFRRVQPEALEDPEEVGIGTKEKKKSQQIRIEQVRELQDFLGIGTHRGGRRVIMLWPANTMNAATQNALLKNIEEPAPNTVFLLLATEVQRLLPTVRSRCQQHAVPIPGREDAVAWLAGEAVDNPEQMLALAGGAPLLAASMAAERAGIGALVQTLSRLDSDWLAAAGTLSTGTPPAAFIDLLYRWCHDLLSQCLGGVPRYFTGQRKTLATLAAGMDPVETGQFLRRLAAARALAQHPLNARLVFEELLFSYRRLLGPGH